jgi:hypothetical protein
VPLAAIRLLLLTALPQAGAWACAVGTAIVTSAGALRASALNAIAERDAAIAERDRLMAINDQDKKSPMNASFSKKIENHAHSVAMFAMYYNFVRIRDVFYFCHRAGLFHAVSGDCAGRFGVPHWVLSPTR